MNIKLDTLSPGQAYFHMIQTLVPRPIAWVLSENETGTYNLAPCAIYDSANILTCISPTWVYSKHSTRVRPHWLPMTPNLTG